MRTILVLALFLVPWTPTAGAADCQNDHVHHQEGGILADPAGLGLGPLLGPGTSTDAARQMPALTADASRTWTFQVACPHFRHFLVDIDLVLPDPFSSEVSQARVYIESPDGSISVPSEHTTQHTRIDAVWYDHVSFEYLVTGDHQRTPGAWKVVLVGTEPLTMYQATLQFG